MSVTSIKFEDISFNMLTANDFVVRGYYEGWEKNSLAHWVRLQKASRVASTVSGTDVTILDIGAYTGIYSLFAAAINPSADVLAFEPLRQVFDRTVANVRWNNFVNVMVDNVGFSDTNGVATIHVTGGSPLPSGSSVDPHPGKTTLKESTISLRTADSYFEEFPLRKPLAMFKMDVERHELAALHGMQKTLETYHPVGLIEILDIHDYIKIRDFMVGLGYNSIQQIDDRPNVSVDSTLTLALDDDKISIVPTNTNFIFQLER